jgi:hypothetical protein
MRLILLCLALVCFTNSFAQSDWIAQDGPYGGEVNDIEYDAGSGWTYAIMGSRLYYSTDLGVSWTQSSLFFGGVDIEIANGTVYFLTGFDVFTSPVGQDNFAEVTTDFDLNARKLRRMPNGTLVAISSIAWIYYSINDGATWDIGASGSGSFSPDFLEVTSDNKVIVVNTSTNTVQFTSTPASGGLSTFGSALADVHSIATSNDGSTVYAVAASSFYSVAAAGGTWTSIEGGTAAATTVSNTSHRSFLEFSADGLNMFFIDNHNHELHYKTVAGASGTWAENSAGFPGTNRIIRNASAIDGTQLFLGTNTDLFKATASGYSQANDAITEVTPVKFGAFGTTLYLQGGSLVTNEGASGVYASYSNGNTWEGEPRIPNPVTSFTYASDFAYKGTDHALALVPALDGVNSDLYRRSGSNWVVVGTAPEFEWVELAEDAQAIGFEFGLTSHPLHYSSDGGATWGLVNVSGLPTDYDLDPENTHLASSQRMLTYVFDMNLGTSSWYRIDINPFSTPMTATATNITSTLPFTNIDKALADNNYFYFVDNSLNPDRYSFSSDGGNTWTTRNMPFTGSAEFFVADNGYLFIVNRFGAEMYMSRNNGTSYTQTDLANTSISQNIADVFLDHEGYALFAVYQDVVYKSREVVVIPDAPGGLNSSNITKNTIVLSWQDEAYNEEYHLIERSINGVNFTEVAKLYADQLCEIPNSITKYPIYVDQDLDPGTEYTYRISTVNDAGASAYTQAAFTTLADCADGTIPDGRSWSAANAGGTGYGATTMSDIGIRHLSGNIYEVQNITMSLTGTPVIGKFTLDCDKTVVLPDAGGEIKPTGPGLWNPVTSTLTLRWYECDDLSKFETVTFTLNPADTDPAPDAPVVQALVSGDSEVEISWTTGFNQKDYVVERSTIDPVNGPFSQIGSGSIVNYPGDSFVDPGPFGNGSIYYYRVTARNHNSTPGTASGVAELVFAKPNFIIPATEVTELISLSFPVVWGDFDADGLDDVMTHSTSGQTLEYLIFKNLGNGDFSKQTITLGTNTAYILFSAIDFNNDGKLDIAAAEGSGTEVDLYQGNGDLTFVKLSSGLVGGLATDVEGAINSVTWSDVDRDGDIDALVIAEDPNNFSIIPPQLFLRGPSGTYSKVSGGDLADHPSNANFAIWTDYDGDAHIDVLIVDGDLCMLYKGTGGGNFTVQPSSGIIDGAASAAWGDYDADGLMDLYIGSLAGNVLYRNNGSGFTRDVTTEISTAGNVTLAPLWIDINNDGLLDLLSPGYFADFFGTGRIFMNTSTGGTTSFSRITTEIISDSQTTALGAASADYDMDGFVDVCLPRSVLSLTSGFSASNFTLYQNNNSTGNWIEVKLQGTSSNRQGVGAKVFVETANKGIYRELQVMSGTRSQSSNNLHFGIGAESAITKITVYWPSGITQVYNNPPINSAITIIEDNTGPVVDVLSPLASATGVSVSTTVEITFDEAPFAVAGKNIYVNSVFDGALRHAQTVITGNKAGNKYTFNITGQLDPLTEYEVSFDAGAFADLYGNEFAGLGSLWTFTTRAAPVAAAIVPDLAATNVAPNTTLSVTFDVATTAVATKQLNIYTSANPGTAAYTLNATAAVPDGNKHTFTLPTPLLSNTAYTAALDVGSFTSTIAGPSPIVNWSFTTAPGPAAGATVPGDLDTDVALDTDLEITFDAATTGVPGVELNVYKTSDPLNAIFTLGADAAVPSGNTQVFNLPSNLDPETTYNVVLDAGAFVDAQSGTSSLVEWSFTTVPRPQVDSQVPLAGAETVAPNTNIIITLDMATTPVAGKKLSLYSAADLINPVDVIDMSEAGSSGNTYTFTPSSVLLVSHDYTVVIDEGAFESASNGATGEISWSFTTAPGPALSVVSPTNASTGIAPNADLSFSVAVAVDAVPGKKLSVFLTTDLVNAVHALDVTSVVPVSGVYTFDLPASLLTNREYKVVVDQGAFVDAQGGTSSALEWTFTTKLGPAMTSRVPDVDATLIALNTSYVMTFAADVTPVGGKFLSLYKSTDMANEVFSVAVDDAVSAGNIQTIASQGILLSNTEYTLILDDGAFVDAQGAVTAGIQWSFTTKPGPAFSVLFPEAGDTNVPPNTDISISFPVLTTAGPGKSIRVTETSDPATVVQLVSAASSDFSSITNTHTYDLLDLKSFTSYTIIADAGAFVDGEGGTSEEFQWSFTTAPGPEPSAYLPLDGEQNAPPNTGIAITFAEVMTLNGGQVRVFKTSNLATPDVTAEILDAETTDNQQFSFTLSGILETNTDYTVRVAAGAFADLESGTTGDIEWSFKTQPAPSVTSRVPTIDATNVVPNTSISVTFGVQTSPVAGQVRVFRHPDMVTPEFIVDVIDATTNPAGTQHTFTLPGVLGTFQDYTVKIAAGAFANTGGAVSETLEWSFKTQPAPSVTSRVPTVDATNVAPNTSISVTFGVQTSPVAGLVRVFKHPDMVTPEFIVDVIDATTSPAGTQHTFTLPGVLGTFQDYTVKIAAGAFANADGAVSEALEWSFKTKPGPQILSTTPGNLAEGVASNTNIVLTFDVPTFPVSGKEVNIYLSTDPGTPIRTLTATDAVLDVNKQTLTISPNLPTQTNVTVTAEAGAFRDATHAVSLERTWTFTTMPGPKVLQVSPLDGEQNVDANTTLEITFDQTITGEAGKMIRLFKDGNVNAVFEADVTSVTPVGSKVTFNVSPKLQAQSNYTVLVDPFAFRDVTGNLSAAITATEWNFTSDGGPSATGITPGHNTTGAPTTAAIEITFSRPLAATVPGKRIQVLVSGSAIVDVDVSSEGSITGSKYILNPATLDTPMEWPAGTQLTVAIEAGAFVDAGDNDSFALAAGTFVFTTEFGPLIINRLPSPGQTGVATTQELRITFDKNVTAVPGKMIRVMNGASEVAISNVATTGLVDGDEYSYPVPSGGWPVDKLLTVTLDPGAFNDAGGKGSLAITGSQWTFATVSVVDTQPPTITFTPIASVEQNSVPASFTAQVTDAGGVASTIMKIRPIGSSAFVEATTSGPAAGIYTYSFAPTSFDDIGAEYYFEATDASNNKATSIRYYTYKRYDAEKNVPSGLVGTGGTKQGWRVIAVPFNLGNNNAVSTVFSELTGGDPAPVYKVDWRMLALSNDPFKWLDYGEFNNIERGKGYMINHTTGRSLTVGAGLIAPSNTRSDLFPMTLKAGWNMIGNPYLTPIDWDDVVELNDLAGSAIVFKKYVGAYTNDRELAAFEGGFVNVDAEMTVLIPFLGQVAEGDRTREVVFLENDWLLPITLKQGDMENTFGGVGMHHASVSAFDRLDDFNGPRFIDFLEMNFEHPNDFPRRFSRDVVPVQDEYMWEFNVDANVEGIAQMTWDPSVNLPPGTELYLWDQASQLIINMSETGNYQFESGETRKFRIYFGRDARDKIRPDRSLLGDSYPNPSTGISYIPFSLPEGNPQYGVKIEVFDLMGKKVSTVTDGSYPPGVHKADWNAHESNAAGLYSIRMTVVTGGNQEVYSGKILLNK